MENVQSKITKEAFEWVAMATAGDDRPILGYVNTMQVDGGYALVGADGFRCHVMHFTDEPSVLGLMPTANTRTYHLDKKQFPDYRVIDPKPEDVVLSFDIYGPSFMMDLDTFRHTKELWLEVRDGALYMADGFNDIESVHVTRCLLDNVTGDPCGRLVRRKYLKQVLNTPFEPQHVTVSFSLNRAVSGTSNGPIKLDFHNGYFGLVMPMFKQDTSENSRIIDSVARIFEPVNMLGETA